MTEQNWKEEIVKELYEKYSVKTASSHESMSWIFTASGSAGSPTNFWLDEIESLLDKQLSDIIKLIEGKKKNYENRYDLGLTKEVIGIYNLALDHILTEIKKGDK